MKELDIATLPLAGQCLLEASAGTGKTYALLDQIQALKWVQNNIANFGGNPDNVTLFGQSAGAWSTCYLMASPLADDLFHKAIMESGGCAEVVSEDVSTQAGLDIAKKFDCDQGSNADIAACLRAIPAKKLSDYAGGALATRDGFKFWPKVDGHVLPDLPIRRLQSGDYQHRPLLAGSNMREQAIVTGMIPWFTIIPSRLMFGKEFTDEFNSSEVQRHYSTSRYRNRYDAWGAYYFDRVVTLQTWQAVNAVSTHTPDTWYYQFDYDEHRLGKQLGTGHNLELPFVFGTLDEMPHFNGEYEAKAKRFQHDMMRYWANFARNGDPNGKGLPKWKAFSTKKPVRMHLDWPMFSVLELGLEKKCESLCKE